MSDHVNVLDLASGIGLADQPFSRHELVPLLQREAGDLTGRRILDLGTDLGRLFSQGFPSAKFAKAIAIDNNPQALATARLQVANPRVQFIGADLSTVDLLQIVEHASIDVAFSICLLNEMQMIDQHLLKVSFALSDKGRLLLMVVHPLVIMAGLLEKQLTGASGMLPGVKSYFDQGGRKIAHTSKLFYPHNFENLFAALQGAHLQVSNVWEPGGKVFPRYLFINAQRRSLR